VIKEKKDEFEQRKKANANTDLTDNGDGELIGTVNLNYNRLIHIFPVTVY